MINWDKVWELLYIISEISKTVKAKENKKKWKRVRFTKKTRSLKLKLQNHRCENCRCYNEYLEFHHKNGNRADNGLENCEALCPNCHAKKTRKNRMN